MKIKELILRNYKRFSDTHPPINFCDEWGEPLDMVLLVGENGSGKSSILQAIAALVGGAVLPDFSPSELQWPGYDYRNMQSGRRPIEISATLGFSPEEIEATQNYAHRLIERYPDRKYTLPGNQDAVTYHLEYPSDKVQARSAKCFFQARGYQYALQLIREKQSAELFDRVGSIYWYTERRNSASIMMTNPGEDEEGRLNEDRLRKMLSKFYRFHRDLERQNRALRPGQRDIYAELESAYRTLFPSRRFIGSVPRMAPQDILEEVEDFFLSDDGNEYEISGMSGGERAIFPMLIDFANWNINNSIILIDEVGLHLHPPLQQALIRALPKLGRNNQFILTTHSDYVASLFQEHQIIRLDQYEQAAIS